MTGCLSVLRFVLALLLFVRFTAAGIFSQAVQQETPCAAETDQSKPALKSNVARRPEIKIRDIKFEGATQLPFSEQNLIASEMMALDLVDEKDWIHEVRDLIREAWEHRGFFKVRVEAEGHELNSRGATKNVSVTVHVIEGKRYTMGAIRFVHGGQFTDEEMRTLFPISDGDVFDTSKIRDGMMALRKQYMHAGFINFIGLIDTSIDEQNARVSPIIEIHEDKQFHISGVKVLGVDQKRINGLLRQYHLEPGDIYDSRRLDEFAREFDLDSEEDVEFKMDEKTATVTLLIDARHCL